MVAKKNFCTSRKRELETSALGSGFPFLFSLYKSLEKWSCNGKPCRIPDFYTSLTKGQQQSIQKYKPKTKPNQNTQTTAFMCRVLNQNQKCIILCLLKKFSPYLHGKIKIKKRENNILVKKKPPPISMFNLYENNI